MYDIKRILGENIKTLRKRYKLTQEQLSEKIGCSLNHLANIEIGKKYPSPKLLSQIANALNVPPAILFKTQDIPSEEDTINKILKIFDSQNEKTKELLKKLHGKG